MLWLALSHASAQGDNSTDHLLASLATKTVGSTAFAYTEISTLNAVFDRGPAAVPTHRGSRCSFWSQWHLIRVDLITHARRYGEFVYDGCNGDKQLFPTPANPAVGSCNNDDNLFPSARFSLCPVLPGGTVPAGMPFDRNCMALAETAVSLHADLSHDPADATNTYTVTTSLSQDFARRLNDATCSDVLDWQITGWEIAWPDGHTDTRPGTGQAGTTDSRPLPPNLVPDPATTRIIVKAHVHITARAVDFDSSANPFVRTVSADVVLTNDPTANQAGLGGAPVYLPPQLRAAAICEEQEGDGRIPTFDPTLTLRTACDTLRGRLLEVFPQVAVVQAGRELIGGVSVGSARSVATAWTYTGGLTDAPARQATPPQATGAPGSPIDVQYNHAARLSSTTGQPLLEQVPFTVTIQTTYPDGHQETAQAGGSLAVTIYYIGLNFTG